VRNFLFFVILLSSTWAFAQAQTYRFTANDFAGLQKTLPSIKKNSFTADQLNDLLKELVLKKDVELARLAEKDGVVYLDMKNLSGQKKVEIVGNQALTTDEVATILGTNKTQQPNKFDIQKNIPRLKERYDAIGLKKVEISFRENGGGSDITYVVEINEGSTTKLEDIIVLSQNSYLNNYIKYRLSAMINQKIDRDVLKKIEATVNEILIDNRILDAKIAKISPVYNQARTSARLTITLESTSTYEFLFTGNTYFSDGNIITALDIDKNFLNYIKNRKLFVKNIELLYRINGFPSASVEAETVYFDKLNKYVLKFNIKEGRQIRIKSITVGGKISRAPSYYVDKIYDNLSELKNSNLYVEENITKAVDKMIMDLKDEGFLRAEKIAVDFKLEKTPNVNVTVQINENILTQIRSINFVGLKSFTASQLYDVIDLKPNTPLNLVKVFNSYNQLKNFYQKSGYLEFNVLTTTDKLIKYVENYEFADITYELKEGPQIRVKDIQARGNDFTKSKVILREVDLKKGDILTSDTVNDSVLFLERTQLFARAQINTSDAGTDVVDRTVFVDVTEKNPGLFSSGVGVSNERDITLRGYLGLAYRNLGGTGRGLSGRGDVQYSIDKRIEYPENRIVVGYYEPFMFYNRLRLNVEALREQQVFDTSNNRVIIEENNEISFKLEKQLTRTFKAIWQIWGLSNLKDFDKDSDFVVRQTNIASIGPQIEWDRRDDLFVPRDGTYTTAQIEYASPELGSTKNISDEINFYRINAAHTVYTPMTQNKKWVWVNEGRAGYLDNLSSDPQSGIPASELFFLGGRSTLRGYDLRTNERVPQLKEVCPTCSTIADYKVHTSSTFFLLKSEIRFPLHGDVGGLVFYDGGAVYIRDVKIEDHYRDTAGFGARYITPIGAFTLEIGFKLDRKEASALYNAESPFTVHISMGSF